MTKMFTLSLLFIIATALLDIFEGEGVCSKRSVINLPAHDEQPVRSYGVNPGDGASQ